MINAGEYNKRISIFKEEANEDNAGFIFKTKSVVLNAWAKVKTTRGYTLIANNTDFEKAYTNFTIRFPVTPINRDMEIDFGGKTYTIQYLNNVDEMNVELEMQCKEVTH